MKTHLGRVDPPPILDLILFKKKKKRIIQYTLEILKTKQNTEEIANRIIQKKEREICVCLLHNYERKYYYRTF
jgi:phosphotransacetylase